MNNTSINTLQSQTKLTLGVILFDGFELLDVFGPLEMFACLPDQIQIVTLAEKKAPIRSAAGPSVLADADFNHAPKLDILLIPGGFGTRQEVNNQHLIQWIKQQAIATKWVLTVCTGAALLAKTGLLDQHKATTNKLAFNWVRQQRMEVDWIEKARWIEDGKFITSSGVAAGMDMSLFFISKLFGKEKSHEIAKQTEYLWNEDANNDPFYRQIDLL